MGQIVFAGRYIHTAHESHTLNVGQGGLAALGFPKPLGFHVKMLSASIHVPRNDKDLWKIRVCLHHGQDGNEIGRNLGCVNIRLP